MVAAASPRSGVITLGPLKVVPADSMAYAGGRTLMLSRREMHLLIELARHAGRIVERDQLSRLAWGRRLRPGDRSVDVYVRKLRVKLEQAAPGWRFIHTHVGFGYRLAPERISSPARSGAADRFAQGV
ncbi:MAG TPA: winged helix-turn-helix domain-containing protein [Solirubrobacteraceae bacterium]|nr:winged helix-turn-helix domain-containing protein [Solirubrobacteraceae bacterium]